MPRVTIGRLMVGVGVLAVNFAAARALYRYDEELAIGLALMGPVSQLALLRALCRRGRARTFWSGFIIASLAAMGTLAWAVCFQDSEMFNAWRYYVECADGALSLIPSAPRLGGGSPSAPALMITAAVILFIPQFFTAITGGLLTILAARLGTKRVKHPSPRTASP